jgi:hypothetical protein
MKDCQVRRERGRSTSEAFTGKNEGSVKSRKGARHREGEREKGKEVVEEKGEEMGVSSPRV